MPREGTYLIGRKPGHGRSGRLVVEHPTVSERHAELVVLDGSYHLTDLGSYNGTWRVRAGTIERLAAGYVDPHERLCLGDHECTLAELFAAPAAPGSQ